MQEDGDGMVREGLSEQGENIKDFPIKVWFFLMRVGQFNTDVW